MIRDLPPKKAAEILEAPGAIYLDVRTAEEFEAGRPAGAWNVPVVFLGGPSGPEQNPDFVDVAVKFLPKDVPIVIGCKTGGRSMTAAKILEAKGYSDLVNVRGGFAGTPDETGWKDAGLPTEAGEAGSRSYASLRQSA